MAEQTFLVDGLHCQGCVATVTTALTTLESVGAVTVDLAPEATSTVRISADAELTAQQVQTALAEHGDFSVVGP